MKKVLGANYFNKPTVEVAKNLLGKFLVRKVGRRTYALMITETEAYDGFKDRASHAHRGKTARNYPMFGEAGKWYVYFTYGMHWMLNMVTGEKNYPAAVLIRAAAFVNINGGICVYIREINGPARLTKFLKIDKNLSNKKANKKTGLWIEDIGIKIFPNQITKSPRIGIRYAGEIWGKKNYRFYLANKNKIVYKRH